MVETGKARARAQGEWTFFAIMSLLVAAVVAAGFGPTYAASLAPPGLPIWVHLHGAVMTAWIVLFAVQAALVRRRSLPLHRSLGLASIALVIVMLPLGMATNLQAIERGATPPFFTPEQVFAADFCDMALFTALYVAALLLRHRPEWHKRLLLSATVLLSWPAIARLRLVQHFGLDAIVPVSIAILVAMALAGPVHDLATRKRVHPAYAWGVGAVIALYPLYNLLAATAPVRAIVASVLPGAG